MELLLFDRSKYPELTKIPDCPEGFMMYFVKIPFAGVGDVVHPIALSNPDDLERIELIFEDLEPFGPFKSTLEFVIGLKAMYAKLGIVSPDTLVFPPPNGIVWIDLAVAEMMIEHVIGCRLVRGCCH